MKKNMMSQLSHSNVDLTSSDDDELEFDFEEEDERGEHTHCDSAAGVDSSTGRCKSTELRVTTFVGHRTVRRH